MEEDLTQHRVPHVDTEKIFGQVARWQAWLKCEAALAMAEAEIGMIPFEAASLIAECCDASLLDPKRIHEVGNSVRCAPRWRRVRPSPHPTHCHSLPLPLALSRPVRLYLCSAVV
jgi:hypothetical protein